MAVGNGVAPRGDVAVGIGAELDEVGVVALEGSTATGTPVGVCAGLAAVVGVGTGLGAGPVPGSSQATVNAATARAVPSIRQRKMRQRVMDMSHILQRPYPSWNIAHRTNGRGRAAIVEAGPTFHSGQQKRGRIHGRARAATVSQRWLPLYLCGLASRADRLLLPLLFHS